LWKRNTERDISEMSPQQWTETNKRTFHQPLGCFKRKFSLYFKVINVSKSEWVKTHLPLIPSPN